MTHAVVIALLTRCSCDFYE